MNTNIYLWVEPMIMQNQKCNDKVYFNCIVEGNYTGLKAFELEDIIEGENMFSIMEFADISCNWNFGVVSSTPTNKKVFIDFAKSPDKVEQEKIEQLAILENIKEEKRISKIVNSKKPIQITKSNLEIKENGIINVKVSALNAFEKIDFNSIWNSIEKEFIGKIKEGDKVILTDDDGNNIFEMIGGSFLNVAIGDMLIYDTKKMSKTKSIYNYGQGLKGGLFIRDDGRLDIGDFKRTFYLTIHTNNLLKASLKMKKSIMELTQQKLLK
jgi:hypothetical protein